MSDRREPDFLAHGDGDSVAIAIRDLSPGRVRGGYLVGPADLEVTLADEVPLGHKFALIDIGAGDDIIEYGQPVATASDDIGVGTHVHTHNVRSKRWQSSIAS